MEKEHVSRSRLFREAFLPGAYARLRNDAYAKVVGVKGGSLDGVDTEQLKDAVMDYILGWEDAGGTVDGGFKQAAQRRVLEIQNPSEIFVTPSPVMVTCNKCGVMDFFDQRTSEEMLIDAVARRVELRNGKPFLPCKRKGCDGVMRQVPYVAVHRCGVAQPISLPFRLKWGKGGSDTLGYRDGGSFFNSQFFDVVTKENYGPSLQGDCRHCNGRYESETNLRGSPITNGETFYAQTTQYIALSEERGRLIAKLMGQISEANGSMSGLGGDIAEGLALALTGCMTGRELEQKLRNMLMNGPSDADEVTAKLAKRAKKVDALHKLQELVDAGNEILLPSLESTQKEIDEITEQLASSSGSFKEVRDLIPDNETLSDLVRHRRSMEAVFLEQDVSACSIGRAIDEADDLLLREAMAHQWSVVSDRYGVECLSHIPDLRVVLAALGYSREKCMPQLAEGTPPVSLNAFDDRHDESMRGKRPIYAMSANTEALWIRLDPRKILTWCVDSAGWEPPPAGTLVDRALSHAWLLRHSRALTMNPGKVLTETASDPIASKAPFHLLHTMSHALMLTARRHTGYDVHSLQEYLLPMDLSMLLYVSSVQNYTAGGLLTLFKHYLQPWFDDASMFAWNCVLEPTCSDMGASCSGCVQIELGCETFNHGLSRAYLHGGAVDRDRTLLLPKGFWDEH